ncbi:hypothetical protein HQ545_05570 [Candidatus Woesearchaeota archaeon]|nr:hypothetical protein [Candidatus Woesearchaeota archaeon]
MAESQYFVQIKDPVDMRKNLLGTSKQIIQILQRYERIKSLRIRKIEKASKLKETNKEINMLVAKMKKEMPNADIRIHPRQDIPEQKVIEKPEHDDLNKLETELRMIEQKIGRLG